MIINDNVRQFEPYQPDRGDYRVRLNKNENPYDLPARIKHEIAEAHAEVAFNRYPHITGDSLRNKIASHTGFDHENIIVGSGSDELIPYFLQLFSGEEVVITPPTFEMYGFYARLLDLKVREVPLKDDFEFPVAEISRLGQEIRCVVLCSPNNPTGNRLSRGNLIKILQAGFPVILDEAYQEFADGACADLVSEYDNLVVLRTFSKAYSLAACRVGYALASPHVIDYALRIKSPYNLNKLSIKAAEVLLDHHGLMTERVNRIVEERERIADELGVHAYPSQANFLLVDLDLGSYLRENGILVRTFGGRLGDMVRVTVGTKEENDAFINLVHEYLGR